MILVDTHIVIWLAFASDNLSGRARQAINEARADGSGLAISSMTLLELAILASKGRLELHASLESFLMEVEAKFAVLPMTYRACARIPQLPTNYPKDPADRIIGATAQEEGLVLITADLAIRQSKAVRTIW